MREVQHYSTCETLIDLLGLDNGYAIRKFNISGPPVERLIY